MARVGVLALQGDVREHRHVLESLGARTASVRSPDGREAVDGLGLAELPGLDEALGLLLLRHQRLYVHRFVDLQPRRHLVERCGERTHLIVRRHEVTPDGVVMERSHIVQALSSCHRKTSF